MRFNKIFLCLGFLALSCFDPQLVDGQFLCQEPPHLCPEEFECQSDCVCRDPNSEPPPDAPTDCELLE